MNKDEILKKSKSKQFKQASTLHGSKLDLIYVGMEAHDTGRIPLYVFLVDDGSAHPEEILTIPEVAPLRYGFQNAKPFERYTVEFHGRIDGTNKHDISIKKVA